MPELARRADGPAPRARAGGAAVPIVCRPTEVGEQRSERKRRVGGAPGDHDLRASAQRFRDRIGAEISIGARDARSHFGKRLSGVEGLTILGPPAIDRGGVVSFTFGPAHPHDVAQIVDRRGVCVRAGHHCAMPLHEKFGLPATARASFYLYNTLAEVDQLVTALEKARALFTRRG